MRVLVCGSRRWTDRAKIRDLLKELPYFAIIAHGGHGKGADRIGMEEASTLGFRVVGYPVDRALDGEWPAAGVRRNSRMVDEFRPEFCFAFRSRGKSAGTDDCVKKCRRAGASVFVITEDSTYMDLMRITYAWEQLRLEGV